MKLRFASFRFASFSFAALAPMAARAQDDRTCGTSSLKQVDYRGDIAVTANGRACQMWTHQSPHGHSQTPQNRPGKGLGEHNHCRNPDGERKAWCYTTDPGKRWEVCAVPDCETYVGEHVPGGDLSPGAVAAVTQEMIDAKYSTTPGWCVNAANGVSVDKFQGDGLFASDAVGAATCYQFCEPFSSAPGFVGVQWRAVSKSARCICYFDDGRVPALLPEGTKAVTQHPSVGPVVGSGDGDHYCMAYKAYMDAERQAIYGAGPLTDYVDMEVYGTNTQVANVMVEYDQNQNPIWEGMAAPAFSADHTTITATGNTWSAYLLPAPVEVHKDTVLQFEFTLNEETTDGFQAVCLDINTEETGPDGKCFVLRSSQGWVSRMINVPTQTGVGEMSNHSIPVGDFFTGTVNYLAVIQDSDGQDRSTGSSSIGNLKLVDLVDDYLQIEIDGTMQNLLNDQVSFSNKGNSNEDTMDYWMALSEDHTSVQINGNQWKALPLNAPYDITANTILEFDITIDQSVDYHAVCLDANTNIEQGRECVVIQDPKENPSRLHHITTKLTTGVAKRLVIPFGSFMNLEKDEVATVNYLAFIQDNDLSSKENGRSTWSGFKLYEDPTRYPIRIAAFGEEVVVDNIQEPLHNNVGEVQDSRDHIMSVSSDGRRVTATSNSWKLLRLPETLLATPATILKFKFEVSQLTELHAICLLDEEHIRDSRSDCFFTAGEQPHSTAQGVKIEPFTPEGGMSSYEIHAGSYFTGEIKYLGFIVDNDLGFTPGDVERIYGQSSWSDIEIYNLPSLQIGYGDSIIEVENHQQSYDQNQDTTPIRNYMADIDGPSITFSGNVWRALELPAPISPAELGNFVISFEFEVKEAAEIHAICLEENREYGDANNPRNVDPRRCVATAFFQSRNQVEEVMFADYQARVGEGHRYALNLAKMFDRTYAPFKFIAFVHDNDADRRSGNSTYSNIAITANLTSCLDTESFSFSLDDCTVANFLGEIQAAMEAKGTCAQSDPLIELMAIFDATQETDVYKGIEKVCSEAYKSDQYDFADNALGIDEATERQLVREYIDGGTVLNYETEAGSAVNIGYVNDEHAGSRLLSWPKHHALDNCDIGAAMCCFVASRTDSAPAADNSDVCYVNMKASRRTARVADGWSVYDNEEDVHCEGFAWGKDGGSLATALRGNALFSVGFADNFLKGDVEQVPGAPLCGCVDRMPVVTNAGCTDVTAPGSAVEVTFDASAGLFRSSFTMGTITYGDCGGVGLVEHYETLVGEGMVTEADVAYMKKRVVGDGGCYDAINGFLSRKGLVMN